MPVPTQTPNAQFSSPLVLTSVLFNNIPNIILTVEQPTMRTVALLLGTA